MIRNHQDFVFGVLSMMIGIAFAVGARDYSIGTAARMGAGYFPFYVACLLCLLGLAISVKSFGRDAAGARIGKLHLRAIVFILGANLLFGILLAGLPAIGLPSMGLLVAVFVTVVVAAMAGRQFVWREVAWLALIMTASCHVLFVRMLKLNLPVFPVFFA